MVNELGKKLLKCGAELLCVGLRRVPLIGMPIELVQDGIQMRDRMKQEQRVLKLEDRVKQLQEAAGCNAEEVKAIVKKAIQASIAAGNHIEPDKQEAIHDIMLSMPCNIGQQIRATISYANRKNTSLFLALPIGDNPNLEQEQNQFYDKLFPSRRPQYKEKMIVPNKPCWEFESMLGMGGFGEVWKIQHKLLKQVQAIKLCLNEANGKILQHEAKTIAVLYEKLSTHENIVAVLDANVENWPYWIAFEYISGGTLENYIQSYGGPMPLAEVIPLFVGICQGVKAAHENNIVHRDLKPANILLTPDNKPKIADFGLGKIIIEETTRQESIQQSLSLRGYGTIGYMSREQRTGEQADTSDDVYSLGVILYQMLIGKASQDPQYLRSDLGELNPKPPQEIINLICDCIEQPRKKRIDTAGHLLDTLVVACQKNKLPISLITTPTNIQTNISNQRIATEQHELEELQKKIFLAKHELERIVAQVATEKKKIETGQNTAVSAPNTSNKTVAPTSQNTIVSAPNTSNKTVAPTGQNTAVSAPNTSNKSVAPTGQFNVSQNPAQVFSEKPKILATNHSETIPTTLWDGKSLLDMSSTKWLKLSWQEQSKYARIYQAEYSRLHGLDIKKNYSISGVNFRMRLIPPGIFLIGSPQDEPGRSDNEHMACIVIGDEFYIGETQVTQLQYRMITGKNESHFKGDGLPVENLSWAEAIAFCAKLNAQLEKDIRKKNIFRLPTEAEWEYICRAGTTSPFNLGPNISTSVVNYDGDYPYNGAPKGKCLDTTVVTGNYLHNKNSWGLFDTHGNVYEWCLDIWKETRQKQTQHANTILSPQHIESGYHVVRGGAWNDIAKHCRSAYRHYCSDRGKDIGFRLLSIV